MDNDTVCIIFCSIMALIAHASRKKKVFEWILRSVIAMFALGYGLSVVFTDSKGAPMLWAISASMASLFVLLLFRHFRSLVSRVLTVVDGIASLRVITGPWRHKMTPMQSIIDRQIFLADSMPHLNGIFCYICCFGVYLGNLNLGPGFNIPLPGLPIQMDTLIKYNGLGLILVSAFGCGLFVGRRPIECFVQRLGWQKPTLRQVGIAMGLVAFSMAFDALWSMHSHTTAGAASQISAYNAGTFAAPKMEDAMLLAVATALCAGIGEETLIRGAFQPVLGIVPSAFLHGIMHAQFHHAPELVLQISVWSCCVGIVRRFTNTTTTIIAHATFNLIFVFLFAYNP